MERLMSTGDAARILGVTPATIRLMERQGRLPSLGRTQGGIRLFRRADVQRVARRRAQRVRPHAQ
jgi:excisionase family DNA binding protein